MSKFKKLFSLLASIALSSVMAPALAQTAATTPAAAAAATPTPVPTPAVTVDGLVDAYYSYNFTNPGTSSSTAGKNTGYFYNSATDSFTLGLAEAKITATQGAASGHLVLGYGEESSLNIGAAPGIDVLQAYVSYNPGQWTFNFGKFVTWMGYEVIESTGNMNYSHSLLFGALPFWHTGFSANYAPSSTFNATVYVTDGDNTTNATPLGKTYGLELGITPNSMWTITLNGILSPFTEPVSFTTQNSFTGEAIIGYKPDGNWSFALDGQYGMWSMPSGIDSPSYFGAALYGKYQIQSDYSAALRLEYLNDSENTAYALGSGGSLYGNGDASGKSDGFTGMEATLTLEHDFTPNMIARLEGRIDMATDSATGGTNDVFATGTTSLSSSMVTGTASVAYTF